MPTHTVGHTASGNRSGYRSYSVDGSDNGQHLGKFPTGIFIGCDRTGNDNTSGTRHSLNQPPAYKLHDGTGIQTSQGS